MLPLIPILLVLAVLLADSGLLLDLGLAAESDSSTTAVVLLSTAPTGLVVIVCMASSPCCTRMGAGRRAGWAGSCVRVTAAWWWLDGWSS